MPEEVNNDELANPNLNSLVKLEGLILSYIDQLEELGVEFGERNQMLENLLSNNSEYEEAAVKAKEANKVKSSIKANILKLPENAKLADEVKDLRVRVREMKKNLSDYLQQYAQLAGTNQFEDNQGEVREIVYVAKLVKRSNKFRT